jgi:hypothetical protein
MANVVFFAAESLLRSSVFATPLAMHLERQPWSPFAPAWVTNRLAALHTTLAEFTPVFDQALALHARSWIIVMALAFTPVPALLFRRLHLPVAAHAVFALHLYAFLLLLLCVGTGVEAWFGGPAAMATWGDPVVSIALLAACAAYLYAADGAQRAFEVATLTVGVATLVLGYRFALFVLTLYTA